MAYLPTSKWGDCTQCTNKDCACVKVGKNLVCLQCHRKNKGQQQIQRATERDKQRRQATSSTQQNQSSKVRSLISSIKNKEVVGDNIGDKVQQAQMDLFWLTAAREIDKNPRCWECGVFIPSKFYRAATAHVLPKRKEYGFPSMAGNLNNYLVLGAGCGCHFRYDSCWEKAAQMKVFALAIEKFKILYPLIPASERKNIPEVFLQEILPV